MFNNSEEAKALVRAWAKEKKYVTKNVVELKENDYRLAREHNIFNMTITEFLEWFDKHAIELFKSVAYSRIKNNSNYHFADYVRDRRNLRKVMKTTKSKVSLVRRNSKLRTSFTVIDGPLLAFGSTLLFDHAFSIQHFPHAVDKDLKYCVQFSGKFKKVADQFCKDIKPDAVYRALQNVRSVAIYHKKSEEIITY